jgi:hypothetical protein
VEIISSVAGIFWSPFKGDSSFTTTNGRLVAPRNSLLLFVLWAKQGENAPAKNVHITTRTTPQLAIEIGRISSPGASA